MANSFKDESGAGFNLSPPLSKKKPLLKETNNSRISFISNSDLPKLQKDLLSANSNQSLQNCMLSGPLNFDQNQVSIFDMLPNIIHVSPIIHIDFSLANLTFQSNGTSIHTPNFKKANQYRDLLEKICLDMYSNELFIPIFGYGAKTFKGSSETCHVFPLSRNMSNPLVPNQGEIIHDTYAECLNQIKLDVPVKMNPTL